MCMGSTAPSSAAQSVIPRARIHVAGGQFVYGLQPNGDNLSHFAEAGYRHYHLCNIG